MGRKASFLAVPALALVLALLAACGGGDDDTPDATSTSRTPTLSTNAPTTTAASTGVVPSVTAGPSATPAPPTPTSPPTETPLPPTPTPIPTEDTTPPLVVVSATGGTRGGTASVTIRTQTGATCSMTFVSPDGIPTPVEGVEPVVVDTTGTVTWTWMIDSNMSPGDAHALIACDDSHRAATIPIGE